MARHPLVGLRPIIAVKMATLTVLLFGVAAQAMASVRLQLGAPRNGYYEYIPTDSTPFGRLLMTADADEPKQSFSLLGGFSPFSIRLADRIVAYNSSSTNFDANPGLGSVVHKSTSFEIEPLAIAIVDGFSNIMQSFLQIRLKGSLATVSDPSLAAMAVMQGLWPSVDAYFEFPPSHAGISQTQFPQTGPTSFISFTIPEPDCVCLVFSALVATAFRRSRPYTFSRD
jgi:hypothetical protein